MERAHPAGRHPSRNVTWFVLIPAKRAKGIYVIGANE